MKRKIELSLAALVLSQALAFAGEPADNAPPRHVSLHEAIELALKHNHNVRIAGFKVEEKQHTKEAAKSAYFPTIRNDSTLVQLTDTQLIEIPAGVSEPFRAARFVPSPQSSIRVGALW